MAHQTQIQFYQGAAAGLPVLASGEPGWTTDTHVLYVGDGTTNHAITGGSGTVTSVGMTAPAGLAVAGSPVTTSGTLALSWSGQIPTANGGTGVDTHLAANGTLLIGNGAGLTLATLTAGSNISITNSAGAITIAATNSGGTVTSVNGAGGTTGLTVTGGPITTSGTLTLGGTVNTLSGGTGLDTHLAGNGQLLIGNGAGWTLASLTAGSNISITNSAGGIRIDAGSTGGTVTSVSVTTANGVSGTVTNPTTTPAIALTLGAITPSSVAATGTVTGSNLSGTNTGDQNLAPYAPLASPALTGTPTAPTAAAGTSTTQVATTAFVAAAVPRSPFYGLACSWLSTASFSVAPGGCPDSTGSATLALATAATVSTASTGPGGMDTKTLSGTVAVTSGGSSVTGTGTAFLTEFGTRAMAGTITSSGTACTGTGTKFLSQVAVNDLIGTSSLGYTRVTAINSDTSLTFGTFPPTAFTGQAPFCIEQPTIKVGTQAAQRVFSVTSNTALATLANFGTTATGQAATAGNLYPGDGSTNYWLFPFLVNSGGTVGVVLSTQRTTPLGTFAAYRRLCALPLDAAGLLLDFTQYASGGRAETHIQASPGTANLRCLSAGNATAFTAVSLRNAVPPTSTLALVKTMLQVVASQYNAYFRASNLPTTLANGWYIAPASAGTTTYAVLYIDTDGAQSIDYKNDVASQSTTYVDALGYVEYP